MIIALYGEKRVGKDTVANILLKYIKYKRVAFADIPKDIICKTFNITLEEFEEHKDHYRPFLINFAEYMKKIKGKDYWAKMALESEYKNILITDLRFKEEYNYIKQFNPIIIHIVDKNIPEKYIHKLPHDYEIDNTEKDLVKLEGQVLKILEELNLYNVPF